MICRLAGALFTLAGLAAPAYGGYGAVRSPDGQRVAYTAPLGEQQVPLTGVWTAGADGSEARLLRAYPGEPGDLAFLPGGRGLIYLERGLTQAAFGGHLAGGYTIPIAHNRVWRLSLDGADEAAWPLPEDLQPEGVAVSPGGERLAVRGARGALPGGAPGLWTVDREGRARRLLSGQVGGPLAWSADGRYILCTGTAGRRAVDAETGAAMHPPAEKGPETEVAPGFEGALAPDARRDMEGALRALGGRGLVRYAIGHYGMHRGDFPKARDMYREVKDVFKSLCREYPKARISKGSCRAYERAMEGMIGLDDRERLELACQEHMLVLHALAQRYAAAHGGQAPADVADLRAWLEAEIDSTATDARAAARDRAALERLYYCPSIPEAGPLIGYVYRLETLPGAPTFACFWHRGRYIRLSETPEGRRVEATDLPEALVDSLIAAGRRSVAAGWTDRTAALLQLVAHQRHKDADIHIRLGYVFLEGKDYERAKRAFGRAISLGGGAKAHYGLGLVYAELPRERYMALNHFREALIKDRDFVDARFQMGRVRYLMGERDAEGELSRVLEMDPNYADAYLLMGDWYANYWENYEKAIVWYTKYVAMRPKDPEVRSRLGAAYLKAEDYDEILETLQGFIREHPDAVELMPIIAQAGMKRGEPEMAMDFFRRYLSKVDPEERAYYEDIRPVGSRAEVVEYLATPEGERARFLERFWNGRDPDITTPVNERLLEHYRRVWYARTEFSEVRQPWDTRGEVYVRFGEPDHRSRSDSPNFRMGLAVQRVKERLASLIYGEDAAGQTFIGPVHPVRSFKRLDEERHRFEEGLIEIAQSDTAGRTLDPGLVQQRAAGLRPEEFSGLVEMNKELGFGHYHPLTTNSQYLSAVPWETWTYVDVAGGIEITFTDEFGGGAFDYAPMPSLVLDEMPARQAMRLRFYAADAVYERAAEVSPDFYAPEYKTEPLDFHYALADFRGKDGKSALEVYYGIPSLRLHYAPEEGLTRQAVRREVALVPEVPDTVYRQAGELVYEAAGDQTGPGRMLADVLRIEVPPGRYRLEVAARDRVRGRLGVYRQQVEVAAYGRDSLQISDLELAWKVETEGGEARFRKGELTVTPMPSRTYRQGQSVFVYYEIYNLVRDEFGQTRYRVEYTVRPKEGVNLGNVISRLVRTIVGKKQEEVTVGVEQVGLATAEKAYVALDLEEGGPGRHELRVEVADLNSGATAVKEAVFIVAR